MAELLVNTEASQKKFIDPELTGEMYEVMAEGAFVGMQTSDQAITKKDDSGEISFADALMYVAAPREFKIAAGVAQAAAS